MTIYEASRAAFSVYAAKHPHEPHANRFEDAQRRHSAWQCRSFGAHPPHSFVLGAVEECGELFEAMAGDAHHAVVDACADACVFLTGLCTVCRLDFGTIFEASAKNYAVLDDATFTILCGRLAHATLKNVQRIRGMTDDAYRERIVGIMVDLLAHFHAVARVYGFDLESAYFQTLDTVLKRDWRASPDTGASP